MGIGWAVPARRGVGVVGFVPAPTRLSIPELDWLTHVRDGGDRTVRVPDHRYSRSDRNAVEAARGRLYSMVSKQIDQTKRVYKARQRDEEGMLPLGSSSPLDMITRDFNERPLIPWHQTSTGRAGVLTTFVAGSGAQLIPGPPIGVDALSRELFQFDCWGTYDVHMTTSPDLFFSGLRGQGKSYCAKVLAVREIGFGRNVIVQSDRQGEWKAIAQAIPGGQVVSPGKGSYLNPFAMAGLVPSERRRGPPRVPAGGPVGPQERHDGVGRGREGTRPSVPVGQRHAFPDRPADRLL